MEELPMNRDEAIRSMRACRDEVRAAQVREFQLAAHVADLYATLDDPWLTLPGAEKLVRFGSDGTPEVAEFCTLEVAAHLGIRDEEAVQLMVDALDVRHRLPTLWRLLDQGRLPVWQARALASIARPLSHQAALELDRRLVPLLPGLSWKRASAFAEATVLELLPAIEADALRAEALETRHVTIGQSHLGVSSIEGRLDAGDAILLDAQLNRVAEILARGGRHENRDARRAMALGVLANPARGLQMLQADLLDELPTDPDEFEACFRAGGAGHTCGSVAVDPDALLPRAELVVHLSDVTLAEGEGLVRSEQLGPLLAQWAADLLGHRRVTIRPLVDANTMAASDAYECPESMRQALTWRNETEVFPWSTKRSTRCDMDHTASYLHAVPGPGEAEAPDRMRGAVPGQTRLSNLGPLSRKVHRAKTHGRWRLSQPEPGLFVWTSPLGHRYLVTRSHTIELDPPNHQHHAGWPSAA